VLVLFGICCLAGGFGLAVYVPAQAENLYGPPDTSLSAFQRWQYSIKLVSSGEPLRFPVDIKSSRVLFEIEPAENVNSIANRLDDQGIIPSADLFTTFLVYRGYDRCLRSGEFYLAGSMNSLEIGEKLCVSTGDRTEFAILPGWRAEEIAGSLTSYGFTFSDREFMTAVRNPDQIADLPKPYSTYSSLEGFLFPTNYPLDKDVSVDGFIQRMIIHFDQTVTQKMRKGYEKQGLSLYEAVILASIVEREAVVDSEKPVIASVFYNRIKSGMRLETDPTVQYALGYTDSQKTWWKVPLNLADLQVNSAFNTYQVGGLPPSPISNPGIESLKAVAFPEDTNYYYFRSACDGSGRHNFAVTLDEHIKNACPE
jgi:UPF0755 protein